MGQSSIVVDQDAVRRREKEGEGEEEEEEEEGSSPSNQCRVLSQQPQLTPGGPAVV